MEELSSLPEDVWRINHPAKILSNPAALTALLATFAAFVVLKVRYRATLIDLNLSTKRSVPYNTLRTSWLARLSLYVIKQITSRKASPYDLIRSYKTTKDACVFHHGSDIISHPLCVELASQHMQKKNKWRLLHF
jgi:hypothetical protein